MAFALPQFSVARNYGLTNAVGGIGGPVPGFKPSTGFTDALIAAQEMEYAATAQAAGLALGEQAATQRLDMLNKSKEEINTEIIKANQKARKFNALAGLLTGGGGVNPMKMQQDMAVVNQNLDGIDNSRALEDRLQVAAGMKALPPIFKRKAGGVDLGSLIPSASLPTAQSPQMPSSGLTQMDLQESIDLINAYNKEIGSKT
jgi:hypothetical protein